MKRKPQRKEPKKFEFTAEGKKRLNQAISSTRQQIKLLCELHSHEPKTSIKQADFECVAVDRAFVPIINQLGQMIDQVTKAMMDARGITTAEVEAEMKEIENQAKGGKK